MRPRSVGDVARAVRGEVVAWDGAHAIAEAAEVRGASIDSRSVRRGDVFVALAGERADGHDFVGDALRGGAVAAIVASDRTFDEPGTLIRVDDPGRALMDLAADERSGLGATVIGITGSTGKTCTKDFCAAVLGTRRDVVRSPASFNNEIGLPLTILATTDRTEVLVCEMGARGIGHVKVLCQIARPQVGIVTNVGVAHMELFGSTDAIREAKGELPASLPAGGTAVLNADDPVVMGYATRTPANVLTFGTGASAAVRADDVRLDPQTGRATFRLGSPWGSTEIRLAVPGDHMVPNALAAAATALSLGISTDDVARGLLSARVSSGRMEVSVTGDGLRVIDDSYNANPTSMSAALRTARAMAGDGRCIAVLGGMAELGSIAAEEHERLGELIVRLGIDRLVAVGADAERIAVAAVREGLEPDRVDRCTDVDAGLDVLRSLARPGDLILVKASRVEGFERIVRALTSDDERADLGEDAAPDGTGRAQGDHEARLGA